MIDHTILFEKRGQHRNIVSVADLIDASGDCWEWLGSRNADGYGQTRVRNIVYYVHTFMYKALVGEIPEGLEIDHICQNKGCVNPDHLEVVTHKENMLRTQNGYRKQLARRTHCDNGHRFTDANTRIRSNGHGRRCITCHKANSAKLYRLNKTKRGTENDEGK